MNKEEILKTLKTIPGLSGIKFPQNMDFKTKAGVLKIIMTENGLVENMQTDSSAFDGWCMVIKTILPNLAEKVELHWSLPNHDKGHTNHYRRFLYRALKFQENYPEWFKLIPSDSAKDLLLEIQQELQNHDWVINYPDRKASEKAEKGEAKLERELLQALPGNHNQQLPTGLFYKKKASTHERTPRCGSQIDLWSIVDNTFTVYELKQESNKKVGIISELMFYTNVIKDLCDGVISYPTDASKETSRDFDKVYQFFSSATQKHVAGVFLTNDLHPLLEAMKKDLMSLLNSNKRDIFYKQMGYKISKIVDL